MRIEFGILTMQIVLKHQHKTTKNLLSRALSTLVNSNNKLDNNSTNNIHKEKNSCSDDSALLIRLQHGSFCNSYVLNKLISSYANSRSLHLGIQIHSFVYKLGFYSHVYICSALVNMYGKCGVISDAHKLFDEMPHRNVITWNSLISGYLDTEYVDISAKLFVLMLRSGISPTHFTVSTVLVGCSQLKILKQLHTLCTKSGFLFNVVVGTALLETYWKCYDINGSRRIFDDLPEKTVVTWTSMITGYAQNQQMDNAMYMIREMLALGHEADSVTYNTTLSSFSNHNDINHCKQIHCRVIKEGLESDIYLSVTLITVYSQFGNSLQDFYNICSTVPIWNSISFNAIIAGFSNLGRGEESIFCFLEMRRAGIDIDFYTISSVLKVIGVVLAVNEGMQVHSLIIKSAHESNMYIQNALISMYGRCGKMNEANFMFLSMVKRDTISWNSLISGYAQHGYGKEAIDAFEQMRTTKIRPDLTTYIIVISACSHVGWFDEGIKYFELMRNDSFLEPLKSDHYACIVDLYARAGYLNEAEEFINSMPIEAGPSVYRALLSGCRGYGNKEIGMRMARKYVDCFPNDPSGYVQLSYMMATEGYWDDSARAHNVMCGKGIKKKAGCSWI